MNTPPSSFGVSHKHDRYDFITNCVAIRQNILFQYWFNDYPSKNWHEFNSMLQKNPRMFYINDQILRQKIYSDDLIECVLDLDDLHLLENIEKAFDIYEILKQNNIKSSVYYSGGKGIHIHFLINNKRSIPKNQVKKFLTLLLSRFQIWKHWFDESALSPDVMITCEGYQKRKTTTFLHKTYIDLEKNFNTEMFLEKMDRHKFKSVVDVDYFKKINNLNESIWMSYDQYVSERKKSPQNQKIVSPSPKNVESISSNRIKQYLLTFSMIYKEKKIISTHHYPGMIVRYLRSEGLNDADLKQYLKVFLKANNISLNKHLRTFIKGVGSSAHVFMFRFRTKDNQKVHECFTFDEFATLNNKNYWIVSAGDSK